MHLETWLHAIKYVEPKTPSIMKCMPIYCIFDNLKQEDSITLDVIVVNFGEAGTERSSGRS